MSLINLSVFFCFSPIHSILAYELSKTNKYPFSSRRIVIIKPNGSLLDFTKFIFLVFLRLVSSCCFFINIYFFHFNYNSSSYRVLERYFPDNLFLLDDGSNSLLIPFRKLPHSPLYTCFDHLSLFSRSIYSLPSIQLTNQSYYKSYLYSHKFLDSSKSCPHSNYILLAGSDLSDVDFMSEDQYINSLISLISYLSPLYPYHSFIYYPHRRESLPKLEKVNSIDNLFCLIPSGPIEIFIACSSFDFDLIVSFSSSFEITLPKYFPSPPDILPVRFFYLHIEKSYRFEYLLLSSGLISSLPSFSPSQQLTNLIIDDTSNVLRSSTFLESQIAIGQFILLSDYDTDLELDISVVVVAWSYHPFLVSNSQIYIWRPFQSYLDKFTGFEPQFLAFFAGMHYA